MLQLRAIWSCRRPRSYRRRSISLIFRMDTFSWATKSPPRPVEELHSPVVQHLRPDELFFRKSFRHVNNDSDGGDFSIHLFSESLIHMPGIFIQNLSEHPIHIARNPQMTVSSEGKRNLLGRIPITLQVVPFITKVLCRTAGSLFRALCQKSSRNRATLF